MPADDVGFVDTMMADLGARLPIDRHRIYASGFSNGADFTARLAVERSDRLAAAAYSGGGLPSPAPPARPVPTYVTVGTLDDRDPRAGRPALPSCRWTRWSILRDAGRSATSSARTTRRSGSTRPPYGAVAEPHSTTFRWPATGPRPLFRSGCSRASATSTRTAATTRTASRPRPEFWDFFSHHRLP